MKKITNIIVITVLILIVATIVVVGFFLDGIVKRGVETIGPQITKVDIKLDSVNILLFSGSAKVKGLVVGNPEGYKAPHAISVGVAAVKVDPLTVLSKKIVVKSIRVEAPEITFEGNPLGKNNLNQILDNVKGTSEQPQQPSTNQAAQAVAPGKKLEVDDFVISGAKVHVNLAGKEMTLPLPPIHLTDLGKSGDGITPADLTRRVMSELVSGTLKAVSKAATNIGSGAENMGKEGVNSIKKGIGGLFGK